MATITPQTLKLLNLTHLVLAILHVSSLLRLLILIYLVGFRFLIPGMDTFFKPLTTISSLITVALSTLGFSILELPLVVVLADNLLKIFIVNYLISEQATNPYLYSLLVIVYSTLSSIEHWRYLNTVSGSLTKLLRIIRVLLYPVVTVVELFCLFNGLKIIDEWWLKVIIFAYVPTRFHFAKALLKRKRS